MTKYKCQSCDIILPICGDGICPCGGDLVPHNEIKAPEIPLAYPELFKPTPLTHDEWCPNGCEREIKCDSGHCEICEIAYNSGVNGGK